MPICVKRPYPTPAAATRALTALRRLKYPELVGIHPCAHCRAWHVTSQRGWVRAPAAQSKLG